MEGLPITAICLGSVKMKNSTCRAVIPILT